MAKKAVARQVPNQPDRRMARFTARYGKRGRTSRCVSTAISMLGRPPCGLPVTSDTVPPIRREPSAIWFRAQRTLPDSAGLSGRVDPFKFLRSPFSQVPHKGLDDHAPHIMVVQVSTKVLIVTIALLVAAVYPTLHLSRHRRSGSDGKLKAAFVILVGPTFEGGENRTRGLQVALHALWHNYLQV